MRTPSSTIQLTLIKPVLCVGHYLVQKEERGGGGREEEQGVGRMEEREGKNLSLQQYTLANDNNSK